METIELLQAEIQMKEHAIRKMQAQIADKEKQQSNIEIDPDDYTDQFDEMLDESGEVFAGGVGFYPSRVLKNLDPIAYRCGLYDYVDSTYSIEDLDEYKEIEEKIKELENEISDLEDQITEAEEEIQDLEETE